MDSEFLTQVKSYRSQFFLSLLFLLPIFIVAGIFGLTLLFFVVAVAFVVSTSLFARWAFIKCPSCNELFFDFSSLLSLLSTRGYVCNSCHKKIE